MAVSQGQENDICVNVTINTDNIIEDAELFGMSLTSPDLTTCGPSATIAFIQITDSTRESDHDLYRRMTEKDPGGLRLFVA